MMYVVVFFDYFVVVIWVNSRAFCNLLGFIVCFKANFLCFWQFLSLSTYSTRFYTFFESRCEDPRYPPASSAPWPVSHKFSSSESTSFPTLSCLPLFFSSYLPLILSSFLFSSFLFLASFFPLAFLFSSLLLVPVAPLGSKHDQGWHLNAIGTYLNRGRMQVSDSSASSSKYLQICNDMYTHTSLVCCEGFASWNHCHMRFPLCGILFP